MTVDRFQYQKHYRFKADYLYHDFLPNLKDIPFRAGDSVQFDGPGFTGTGRFYTWVEGVPRLLIIKSKDAFKIFEEVK